MRNLKDPIGSSTHDLPACTADHKLHPSINISKFLIFEPVTNKKERLQIFLDRPLLLKWEEDLNNAIDEYRKGSFCAINSRQNRAVLDLVSFNRLSVQPNRVSVVQRHCLHSTRRNNELRSC
jgi:hypothetical protein